MAVRRFANQDELDRTIQAGRGWLYNRFYRKLHHASCRTLRAAVGPSIANFEELLESWEDTRTFRVERCHVCDPHASQDGIGREGLGAK